MEFDRKRNHFPVKASIQQTTTGKIILRLSIQETDADTLLLERGVQPDGIFGSIIITRREGYN